MQKVMVTKNGVLVCCGYQDETGDICNTPESGDALRWRISPYQLPDCTIAPVSFFPGEKVDVMLDGKCCSPNELVIWFGEGRMHTTHGRAWDLSKYSLRPHVEMVEVKVVLTREEAEARAETEGSGGGPYSSATYKLNAACREALKEKQTGQA